MNKTKIICTMGPSVDSKEVFTELVKNGLSIARLNLSHGDNDYRINLINMIKEVRQELNEPTGILMDTRGPEIRAKFFEGGRAELVTGEEVRLCLGDFEGTKERFCISYPELYKDVKIGNSILIDDGLIEVEVKAIDGTEIVCVIKNGGVVKNRKGINVPSVDVSLPALMDSDMEDIKFGIQHGIDFLAASFIRSKEDVESVRSFLNENGGEHVMIISKIENQTGVDNIDEIIEASDGVMVARGDLGVETPAEDIPKIQKHIIQQCNRAGKPVITATQMLDSMINNPRPTRAEVSDVANAVFDGTDAIMLSGETAAGDYPINAVSMMKKIAIATEEDTDYYAGVHTRLEHAVEKSVTNAVSYASCTTAMTLDAAAIITPTESGTTARMVSMFRPEAPIIATTTNERTLRQLNINWGIRPVLLESEQSPEALFEKAAQKAKEIGYANVGDKVVITAGVPLNAKGNTNIMKVMEVK